MRPVDKSKQKASRSRRTYKTTDDFLRWLREKNARQKQLTQEEITQAEFAPTLELMVWEDDGGATG